MVVLRVILRLVSSFSGKNPALEDDCAVPLGVTFMVLSSTPTSQLL